jgi:hypothetical protein
MKKLAGRTGRVLGMACAVLMMVACESKLTQESFARIKPGMTLGEVQTILGSSGTEESSAGGMSISGAGIAGSSKESKERIFVWKEGEATITVVIADGKVVEARQTGL